MSNDFISVRNEDYFIDKGSELVETLTYLEFF